MSREDRSVLGWGAFGVAMAALGLAMFGLRDDSGASESAGTGGGGVATVETVDVALADFSISPNMIMIAAEGRLEVTNNSPSTVHNFVIPELGLRTPDLQPGESYTIDLSGVAPGTYDTLCDIPGHAGAGMAGSLMIGSSGGSSGSADGGSAGSAGGGSGGGDMMMSWQDMDRVMEEVALAFPAATEGTGGQLLEYTMSDDGYKVFDVTAKIVDWEVEPGKFVEAWTYNGQVPAPEIRVEVGDKVRINLTNELPESTVIHYHGIRVPNEMDGVPPYTQPPVPPGGTWTYEFEALEPAVGIYHSHHNAQVQVPNGLFGAFIIGDMPIPDYLQDRGITTIDKEVTMVLNDAGTIGLSLNGKSFPATEPYTLRKGQTMLVHYLNEGLMAHPMHLHQPMGWVIAKDGIPLDIPLPGDTINVAPGERYTVLYQAQDVGVWAWHCHILTHAEGSEGMFGMVTALIVTE